MNLSQRTARRVAALLAAAGMVLAAMAVPPAASGGTPPGDPARLRVLSFNIWFSGTAVPDGLDYVVETIRMQDANVVLLSESGTATQAIADELSTPGHPYYAASSGDTGIVSEFPIVSESDLPNVKKAVLDVGAREVAVYSAHLYYRNYATYLPRGYGAGVDEPSPYAQYGWDEMPGGPVTDREAILKVNQDSGRPEVIRQVIEDAAAERARGRAVILGGDFNEPSTHDWTGATSSLFDHHGLTIPWQTTELLDDAGYVDAYRATFPDPVTHPGFTWPSDNADKAVSDLTWAPKADERDRIDYVFHVPAPGMKLLGAGVVGPRSTIVRNERVIEATRDRFLPIPAHWPSDHKAVLATYRLAGGPPGA